MPAATATHNPALVRVVTATRPLLRVSRPQEGQYIWLRKGREGSLQTAVEMAKLVRHDSVSDEGLERFAVNKIIKAGLDSHARPEDVIEVLFRFVQGVPYIFDPAGSFDSVQNARHTLDKGYGDCDDLAVLLATLLALAGYRPRFVLAQYKQASQGFDHVYVDVVLPSGRIALDPTARSHGMGWEKRESIERLTFPIFAGRISGQRFSGLGNAIALAEPLLQAGLSIAGSLFSTAVSNSMTKRVQESTRDNWKNQVNDGMLQIQRAVDACQITTAQGVAAAKDLVAQYYAACDASLSNKDVARSCRNFETQDTPGGVQEGNFVTRARAIANAGGSCTLDSNGAPGVTAGSVGAGNVYAAGSAPALVVGSTPISWTMLILIAGGLFLIVQMR